MSYVENEKVRKKWRDEGKTTKNEVNRVEVLDIAANGRKNKLEWDGSDGDEGESGGSGDSNERDLVESGGAGGHNEHKSRWIQQDRRAGHLLTLQDLSLIHI